MATSSSSPSTLSVLLLNLLLLLALTPVAFSTFSSSSVGSSQLEFWSQNVVNVMPKQIASKLSPLSNQDSDLLASSVSTGQSLSSSPKFCSMASFACSITSNSLQTIITGYNTYGAYERKSFFRLSSLQKGNKVQLPNLNNPMPSRAFLPSKISSQFSTVSSKDLQKLFPESFTSSTTKEAMEISISRCTSPNFKGEVKSCPNSLEDMIEFSKKALGDKKLIAFTNRNTRGSNKELEIGNIKEYDAEKVVSCHEVFFPFAAYYCHTLTSTRLYAVDFFEPTATKAPVNRILAMCHMDTSGWPAEDEVFEILKSSPGKGEVCHWFNQVDVVWMGNGEKI